MNFGGLLSIARTGLNASQAQIAVTSQNVTNAQTPGYSRQRLEVTQNYPLRYPQGNFGTGVSVRGTMRMRDEMLDAGYRRDAEYAAYHGEQRDTMQGIEGILGEPSDTGLASSLEQFWNSWSDLSINPESGAARGVVRMRGAQVATQLNTFGNQIVEQQTTTRTRMLEGADRVNALASQVAEINARIVAAEADGKEAPDMRDQRDSKIDELAKLVGATAYPQADGSVNVNIGGDSLVDGGNFKTVRVQSDPANPARLGLALGDPPSAGGLSELMYGVGGQMLGLATAYNDTLPTALAKLDGIASAIVTQVNTLHTAGFSGTTAGGNFFDAGSTTARTIKLDAAIVADVNKVVASGVSGAGGDNTVALAISGLRDTKVPVNGTMASISEGYRTVVAFTATTASSANGSATAAETLAKQSDTRRESLKGVSIDEEMVNLMKYQQSYAAAARLIAVVDEMSQTLINMAR